MKPYYTKGIDKASSMIDYCLKKYRGLINEGGLSFEKVDLRNGSLNNFLNNDTKNIFLCILFLNVDIS